MRPEPGEVLHFSEDPAITLFVPHVAATAQQPEPYVCRPGPRARLLVPPPMPARHGLDPAGHEP